MLISMLGRLRVLLIEDAALMRDSLAALLGVEIGIEVIAAISSSARDVRLPTATRPDVVVLDFARAGAAETVATVRDRWPSTRVLVLSASPDERLLAAAFRAGVSGYLLWSDTRAELMTALRRVGDGNRYLGRSVRNRVGAGDPGRVPPAAADGHSLLTDREREIMQCVASGLRTREIAERLSLSHKTVEKHRSNLMRKLGLRSAAAVAAYAIAKGYVRA